MWKMYINITYVIFVVTCAMVGVAQNLFHTQSLTPFTTKTHATKKERYP
jgi:hypothetical protein